MRIGMGGAVRLAALDARSKLEAHGAAKSGPIDLAALMRASGESEIAGEGKFELGGAPVSFNGSGTPYAMQSWGAKGRCHVSARAAIFRPSVSPPVQHRSTITTCAASRSSISL